MPELALQIRKDFSQYTGFHPGMTLSGGLSFIGGKYPIYQAADDAKDALDEAKNLKGKDGF
jgi:CRISPR-associated protein Csm1